MSPRLEQVAFPLRWNPILIGLWLLCAASVSAAQPAQTTAATPTSQPDQPATVLSLGEAMRLALDQSPELRPAATVAQRAHSALGAVGTPAITPPQVEIAAGTRRLADGQLTPEFGLAVNQNLSLSGLTSTRRAHGTANARLREALLGEQRLALAREVALLWLELRTSERRILLHAQRVERSRLLSDTLERRATVGAAPPAEAALARAALGRAETELHRAEDGNSALQQHLRLLLDVPPPTELSTRGSLPEAPTAVAGGMHPAGVVATRSAEVVDAEADLLLAEGGTHLNVGLGVTREGTGDWIFLGTVRVPLPFFNGNEYQASQHRVPAAGFRVEAQHWRERQQRQRQFFEAYDARQRRLLESIQQGELAAAENAHRVAEAEYSAGKVAVPLLLSAAEAVANAREHLLDAELELLKTQVERAWNDGTLLKWASPARSLR